MIYVEMRLDVARDKVKDALDYYQNEILASDKRMAERVGGKLIGFWYTRYGKTGELTMLFAYPNLDARDKVKQVEKEDVELQKKLVDWYAYTPTATVRVLYPAAFSPLQ
jgi:hypothetical protein